MNKASQCAETGEYWNCLLMLSRLDCLDCIVIMFSPEVPLLEKLHHQALSADPASWEKLKYREKERDFVDLILVLLD